MNDPFDSDGEFYISLIGFFEEDTYTEGSYEEGYYVCLRLIPVVVGYEIVKKEDAEHLICEY